MRRHIRSTAAVSDGLARPLAVRTGVPVSAAWVELASGRTR